jgi:hypothetical protein
MLFGGVRLCILPTYEMTWRFNNRKNPYLFWDTMLTLIASDNLKYKKRQITINTLLRRLPDLELAVPGESLRWRTSPLPGGLEALPVRF